MDQKQTKKLQTNLPFSEAHLAEQIISICTDMTNVYEPLLRWFIQITGKTVG